MELGVGVDVEVGMGVGVRLGDSGCVGVGVNVGTGDSIGTGVAFGVGDRVAVGETDRVEVGVNVGDAVGQGEAVIVGVGKGVSGVEGSEAKVVKLLEQTKIPASKKARNRFMTNILYISFNTYSTINLPKSFMNYRCFMSSFRLPRRRGGWDCQKHWRRGSSGPSASAVCAYRIRSSR